MWYQFFKYSMFVPYTKAVLRPRVEGAENIPADGGCLIAANHLSAGDTFMLPASIAPQVTFPAKAELFVGNHGPSSKMVAWFLKSVGQVPMDRTGGKASADGLRPVLDALESGHVVGIFPEGTRSPDGNLYKGHTGVARLALTAGAPVVPVGLINTEMQRGPLRIPTMDHPVIRIGKPLDFSHHPEDADPRTIRQITSEVMAAIQQLTGQDYYDVYASRVKKGELTPEQLAAFKRPYPGAPAPKRQSPAGGEA